MGSNHWPQAYESCVLTFRVKTTPKKKTKTPLTLLFSFWLHTAINLDSRQTFIGALEHVWSMKDSYHGNEILKAVVFPLYARPCWDSQAPQERYQSRLENRTFFGTRLTYLRTLTLIMSIIVCFTQTGLIKNISKIRKKR